MAKAARKTIYRQYTPLQLLTYEDCGCDKQNKRTPPGWLLDKIAEEKLYGGYDTSKSNFCNGCFTYKSVNNTCNC